MIYSELKNNKQLGAVSLFVVVFAALLLTVITISFVRIMIQDQQQATANDLANSAYDSAQAGVEDAKRALSICSSGGDCLNINSDICNLAVGSLSDLSNSITNEGVKIQNGSTNLLDQAYTCVKIKTDTPDYLGELTKDSNRLIPLVGSSDFKKIKIEWFSQKDLPASVSNVSLLNPPEAPLLNQTNWPVNRPPIMRVQIIQVGGSFSLNELDTSTKGGALFLYPSNIIDTIKDMPATRLAPSSPVLTHCVSDLLGTTDYACSATIVVSGVANTYLNLEALYGGANYRITLLDNAGSVVNFKNVQPEIDSTGRANDYFKRVKVRVETADTSFPYPTATVDVTGNFCKDFTVTDNISDYNNQCLL